MPPTLMGDRAMLSFTDRCGNRLNCWNTKPMRARRWLMSTLSPLMLWPCTRMVPLWISSSLLMVRIMVDLPEPEGPHTTSTSPVRTSPQMLLRAWYLRYHLFTLSNWIICLSMRARLDRQPQAPVPQVLLEPLGQPRQQRAQQEIKQRQHQVGAQRARQLDAVDLLGRERRFLDADDVDDGGRLDGRDELVQQRRNHVAQCLRQLHRPHGLEVAQPHRPRGFHLAGRQRLDAGPHDLGEEGRFI